MKNGDAIREALIENTIHLIGNGGFEKATTKALAHSGEQLPNFKMNEVYIYRFFGSKEQLYESVFLRLDSELFYTLQDGIKLAYASEGQTKEKLYECFLTVWSFILGDEDRCRCYVRYYYSIYFKGTSLETHKKLFSGMADALAPMFKEEADVFSILHSVFTALFDFAIRVYNGELEDNEINRPHIFNVLYCMMASYFKDELRTDANISPCA